MQIKSIGLTDVGTRRVVNEDNFVCLDDFNTWVVADGMGGHSAGDIASKLVVDSFMQLSDSLQLGGAGGTITDRANFLVDAICLANRTIRQHAIKHDLNVIGSTVVATYITEAFGVVAWIGDSRLLLWRDRVLTSLTTDHSLVQELITAGEIDEGEASTHPAKNIITRAVGVETVCAPEVQLFIPQVGDVYFLCSDGFYNNIDLEQYLRLTPSISNSKQFCSGLMHASIEDGADDNVTFVMIEVLE